MKKICIVLLFAGLFGSLSAQSTRSVQTQNITWLGYLNTLQINPQWSFSSETQVRYFLDGGSRNLWAVRFRLYRKLGHDWDFAPGFARFVTLRNEPKLPALAVPEVRPVLEFNHRQRLDSRWLLHHRYIGEARFFRKTANASLAPGYNINWRFRYRFGVDFDILKTKKTANALKIRLFDELMVNAGAKVGRNFFDQNRVFAGLQIPLARNLNLEAGYLKIFQQRPSGDDFYERNVWRLTLLHRIVLNKPTDKN